MIFGFRLFPNLAMYLVIAVLVGGWVFSVYYKWLDSRGGEDYLWQLSYL